MWFDSPLVLLILGNPGALRVTLSSIKRAPVLYEGKYKTVMSNTLWVGYKLRKAELLCS